MDRATDFSLENAENMLVQLPDENGIMCVTGTIAKSPIPLDHWFSCNLQHLYMHGRFAIRFTPLITKLIFENYRTKERDIGYIAKEMRGKLYPQLTLISETVLLQPFLWIKMKLKQFPLAMLRRSTLQIHLFPQIS